MASPAVKENCFSLPPNLNVRAINAVQQELIDIIDNNGSAVIEIADDSQIDISFIQLMEAARIYAGTAGKKLTLAKAASGSLHDVLQRAGFLEDMPAKDAQFWLHQGGMQ